MDMLGLMQSMGDTLPGNPFADALGEAFGEVVRKAVAEELKPLIEKVERLETQVAEWASLIEGIKTKGGMLPKLLGL